MEKHSTWEYKFSKSEIKVGEEIELIFQAKIDEKWYMYSTDFDPDLGPLVTTFNFNSPVGYELIGKIKPINPKKKFEEIWGGDITYFIDHAEFRQRIKVTGNISKISGAIEYQECSEIDGKCIPHELDFSFPSIKVISTGSTIVPPINQDLPKKADAIKTPDTSTNVTHSNTAKPSLDTVASGKQEVLSKEVAAFNKQLLEESKKKSSEEGNGLFAFMLAAFLAGIIALLTPCVYPMIPMTVTFFSTHSQSRATAITKAIVYGLSIIVIYTVLGILVSLIFGPDALNYASTHWITNIIFFSIFIVFALSFFGLFEITLPSSLVNKVDSQSDKGGYYGVFFMAFTIVLVSFSCTGPIVASILLAAAQGEVLMPALGMFSFSLAFALPFSLFAIFPKWINGLPKSGGWLNSVKVVLGFVELALAFKFLSVADQVYHWGILDRDIFLVIWIGIFTLLGFYLLGKFKLAHDSDTSHVGIFRMLFALASFCFVIYMTPGLFGAPLKGLSGLIPPMSTQDFNLISYLKNEPVNEARESSDICTIPKYADLLEIPHGIEGYFDLNQALTCAATAGKPVFIDFTGHGCTNCRQMEANVWSDPKVLNKLQEEFVVVALYIDERTELPANEIYTSDYDNKVKNSVGKKNFDIEKKFFFSNAQPYYCLVDPSGKLLTVPQGYDTDVSNFLRFLNTGLKEFEERKGAVQY